MLALLNVEDKLQISFFIYFSKEQNNKVLRSIEQVDKKR